MQLQQKTFRPTVFARSKMAVAYKTSKFLVQTVDVTFRYRY